MPELRPRVDILAPGLHKELLVKRNNRRTTPRNNLKKVKNRAADLVCRQDPGRQDLGRLMGLAGPRRHVRRHGRCHVGHIEKVER